MSKEKFEDIAFQRKTLLVIAQANGIIAEYAARNQRLTVRQIYYQFVSRDLIPNTLKDYKRLAGVLDNARKAGLMDWDAIHDRTRFLRQVTTFGDGSDFLQRGGRYWYYEALWRNQETHCEVWIEKDALLGVVEPVCDDLRVPYFACRGYVSSSEMYDAGKRLRRKLDQGKRVTIFDLHDHDPSGLNMTEVVAEWLATYGRTSRIEVVRLALNMDQIEEYDPPPNPAKESDSRFEGYQRRFGDESWELDALSPLVLEQTIRDAVQPLIDQDVWDEDLAAEAAERERVVLVGGRFDEAYEFLTREDDEA